MAPAINGGAPAALTRRLLNDIEEIRKEPYPNIFLHIDDANISEICLILTPEGSKPLHFTLRFEKYPIRPPVVTIQSFVRHPNVFDTGYVCASMLNTKEGWTSAYTLKGVVIQLLSFFTAERVEQSYGGRFVDMAQYRKDNMIFRPRNDQHTYVKENYVCKTCGFGTPNAPQNGTPEPTVDQDACPTTHTNLAGLYPSVGRNGPSRLLELPTEIWLEIFALLDTQYIVAFCDAIPAAKSIVNSFDFIRTRELQCFCLKRSFWTTRLGVGVSINSGGRKGFTSEFDLISREAFGQYSVRRSVQGVPFQRWVPLALSRRHWNQVRPIVDSYLDTLRREARLDSSNNIHVIYSFMNNVVIQFCTDSDKMQSAESRSTLTHASEKAVEAYFSLFHLLLCIACDQPRFVEEANQMVQSFLAGPRTKAHFPDLGWLLVATLISDIGLTEDLAFQIIREAVLRNVVWMLDSRSAGMAELAYIEPDAFSQYRLDQTFKAATTSYRLLMFMKLFSSTARPAGKAIVELREKLFDTHGAPPSGVSAAMAQRIRDIRGVNNFPTFLKAMGIRTMPSKEAFSSFLKRTITDSVAAGYSVTPITQSQAYLLRKDKERCVEVSAKVRVTPEVQGWYRRGATVDTFFPQKGFGGNRGGRGGRGGGRAHGGNWRGGQT